MALDLATMSLGWLFSYSMSKVANATTNALFPSDASRRELNSAVSMWMSDLPEDMSLSDPRAFFDERRDGSGPRYKALQSALQAERLPEAYEIHQALIEQWTATREELGAEAAPFFLAPRGKAGGQLYELAEALRSCLEVDPKFFMREMLKRTAEQGETTAKAQDSGGPNVTFSGTFTNSPPVVGDGNNVTVAGQHIHNNGAVGEQFNVAGDGHFDMRKLRRKK